MSNTTIRQAATPSRTLHQLDSNPGFALSEILNILIRWRFFIVLVTLATAFACALMLTTRKRDFEAYASILIDPRGIEVVERDVNPRSQSADGNFAIIESQMRVMKSEPVLKEVIRSKNLAEDAEFGGSSTTSQSAAGELFSALLGRRSNDLQNRETKALYKLKKAVATYRPQLSYVIELSVRSQDPGKAAELANAVAETYLRQEAQTRSGIAKAAADNLSARLDELRSQLTEAENAIEQYKLQNNIVSVPGGLVNEQELAQVNRMLVEARNATSAAKITLDAINQLKSSGNIPQNLPETLRSPTIVNLREQLSRATERKIGLSAQYLDTHPVMRAEELRVAEIRKSLFEEIDRVAQAAQLSYDNTLKQEKELQAKVINLTNKTYSTNDARIKLRELERDADTKQAVYESFLKRAREISEQASIDTAKAKIVSPASPPLDPIGLSSSVLAMAGTLAGFVSSCVFALVASAVIGGAGSTAKQGRRKPKPDKATLTRWLKPSVGQNHAKQGPQLITETDALELPVLGRLSLPHSHFVGGKFPVLSDAQQGGALSRIVQEISRFAEPGAVRTVLVTGFADTFGKSAFAANLTCELSNAGMNTMILAADRDCLSMHETFVSQIGHEDAVSGTFKQAVGDTMVAQAAPPAIRIWPFASFSSALQEKVQLKRLKTFVSEKGNFSGVLVIDAPLLDENSDRLDALADLAKEAIVVMPSSSIDHGGASRSHFKKLEQAKTRIRGIVATGYTA